MSEAAIWGALILVAVLKARGESSLAERPLRVGDVVPEYAATLLDGDHLASDALSGDVVVKGWATLCVPCWKTLPELDAF